jgi:polar amino acid transport system substrate-binding protein
MRRLLRLLACCLLLTPCARAEPIELQILTEEYAPVSFLRDGVADGMAPELVRALLQRLGETASIQVVPWSRGFHTVQRTPGTALFVTIRNAEREPLFKWVGPVLLTQDSYYALKGSGLKIEHPQQLNEVGPIAVPRAWFSYQELSAAGMPNLLGVTEPEQMFRMLRHGRVKLIVADNLSFYARGEAARQVDGLGEDDVEVVYPYRASEGYITFWPGTEDAVIERWQTELDRMKADGSFSRIYQRWLPGAEEPR